MFWRMWIMATFDELVDQVNNNLDKQRDRGTAFEK